MDTTKIVEKIKYGNVELKMKTTTLQAKSVDPSVDEQFVLPDSEYGGLSSVTVKGVTSAIDKNIIPGNIRKGKVILGVEGDMEPDKPDQSKTVTPTKQEQEVHADPGYELLSVTVEGVTSDIDENIQADNIRYGVEILGVVGTMEQKEDLDAELNEQESLLSDLQSQVDNLPEIDLGGATATESDVVLGKTFFSGDNVIKTGTLRIGGEEVTVNLPDAFSSAEDLYFVEVSKDKVLISSDASGCGLWLYTISTGTMSQVYSSGYKWRYFQQVTDTKWLVCYDYILVYDATNDSVTRIYNASYAYANVFQQVTDTKWLLCSSSNSSGIFLYNSSDDSVTQIFSLGYGWETYQKVTNNKWLIGARNNSAVGLLLYNSNNDTISKIYERYSYWKFSKINETLCLLGPSDSNSGVLLYNATDDSVSQIYSSGNYWYYFKQVSDTTWLISSEYSSSPGLLKFDLTTQTVTQIFTSGYRYDIYQQIDAEKGVIIGSTGIYLYNLSDDSLTLLKSGYWTSIQKVGTTKCLIGSVGSSSKGVLIYDSTTNTIASGYSTYYGWIYFQPIGTDKCLVGSNYGSAATSSGLLLYDANTDTIRKIFSTGFAYDTFVLDGNNCYISSSNKTESRLVLYYNADTNSVSLSGFYLGEV